MQGHIEKYGTNSETISLWHYGAAAIAIIGGAFSFIVLTLLIINYFQTSITLPKLEGQLLVLKEEIRNKPDNQQPFDIAQGGEPVEPLLSQIRQLDLQIRRYRFRRLDFSYKGAILLFGGVVVLLLGAKWLGTFKKKKPAPYPRSSLWDEQAKKTKLARLTVITASVVLVLGVLSLAMMPSVDFVQTDLKDASYSYMGQTSKNWHCFRGFGGSGVSYFTNIPASWNGRTGEGILWKTRVSLPGNSSPAIWDDRVFLSGATNNNQQVYCFDALSGTLLWQGDLSQSSIKEAEEAGFASPTVVTNGKQVCAIFATGDVGCFDFHGKRIWGRNLGVPDSAYGYASSLAIHQKLLLIQFDQGSVEDGKSKFIALDVSSGATIWEAKRPVSGSWSSPIVAEIGNQYQIITCSNPWVISYNPVNGTELWRAKCLSGDIAPSPIYAGGLIFAVEPYAGLVAIKPDGQGDVTKTHIAWSVRCNAPDICSPVSNGEVIFLLSSEGLLSCYKVADGVLVWEQELRENFRASPSMVGDKLYLLSEEGIMFIVGVGAEYKELARCKLGERCYATPAFADGRIYIRGLENLYCIGKKD
jgi:outer membrane protein assembly factor BamB